MNTKKIWNPRLKKPDQQQWQEMSKAEKDEYYIEIPNHDHEEIKELLQTAQKELEKKMNEALVKYNKDTGLFIKGEFSFYSLPGYGDRPVIYMAGIRMQPTFAPEIFEFDVSEKHKDRALIDPNTDSL